jgi:hypothetical protein
MSLYDLDYYELMLRQNSGTAEKINKIRWDFVNLVDIKSVLDYGCGCGWFKAWKPVGIMVDTFDIGEYPQTGIVHNEYDLITLWDVLEHLPNFEVLEELFFDTKYVAISVPIKPKKVKLETWKHYKPGEHLHYFTEEMLDTFFKTYGFRRIKKGQPECPPRQDIWDFLYEKNNP